MIEDKDKQRMKIGLLVLLALCVAALILINFLPAEETSENKLKEATTAQKTILQLRDDALELGIDTLTSMNFDKAFKAEFNGNHAFADGNYTKALPFYNDAISLYREALKDEPIPQPIPTPEPDSVVEVPNPGRSDKGKPVPPRPPKPPGELGQLKQQLESARNAMLHARSAAVSADAINLAPSDWQAAENTKGEGDRRYNSKSDNKSSIETNIKSYEKAKQYYNQAEKLAKSKKEE